MLVVLRGWGAWRGGGMDVGVESCGFWVGGGLLLVVFCRWLRVGSGFSANCGWGFIGVRGRVLEDGRGRWGVVGCGGVGWVCGEVGVRWGGGWVWCC